MKKKSHSEQKSTFITEARRQQIMEAAIQTLDEIGFKQASLAQIAKRAGISTALISYHFKDKNDLMNTLLITLFEASNAYVLERIPPEAQPGEQLRAFITASLAYQVTHTVENIALLEIIFNARTPDNVSYYKLDSEEEEPLPKALVEILRKGQEGGEFGDFNVIVMATMIQGAISEYMLNAQVARKADVETYCDELVKIVKKAMTK